jgi:hypothetical protein
MKYYYLAIVLAFVSFSCREKTSSENDKKDISSKESLLHKSKSSKQKGKYYSEDERISFVKQQILKRNVDNTIKFHILELAKENSSAAKSLLLEGLSSPDADTFKLIICDLIEALLKTGDCQSTLNWVKENPILLSGDYWVTISQLIADKNPQVGIDTALELPSSRFRNELLIASVREISIREPHKIEGILSKLSNDDEKNTVLMCVGNELIKIKNEDLAIEYFKKLPMGSMARQSGIAWSYVGILARDPSKFPAQFKELALSDQLAILNNAKFKTEFFLAFKAEDVLSILMNVTVTRDSMRTYENYVKSIADRSPELVAEWLGNDQKGAYWQELNQKVYQNIANRDVDLAINLISKISDSDNKNSAMKGLVSAISTKNLDRAFSLSLQSTNTQEVKSNLYKLISRDNALNNPKQAVAILERVDFNQYVDTNFRNEMINHTVQNWAKQSLEEAQQWVEKLPATDQPKGVQGLVATWMKSDPIAASEWLSKQSAGPARDAGAQEIINQIKDTDPEMAEQWRKSMTPKQ